MKAKCFLILLLASNAVNVMLHLEALDVFLNPEYSTTNRSLMSATMDFPILVVNSLARIEFVEEGRQRYRDFSFHSPTSFYSLPNILFEPHH